jgi:threonine dehydratase
MEMAELYSLDVLRASSALSVSDTKPTRRHVLISVQDIERVRATLPPNIVRTPTLINEPISEQIGCELFLKLENLQITGSYKSRAAFAILNELAPEERQRGAAISSSGNFATAFAYMGRLLNIPTAVVMMQKTSPFKIEGARRYGAEIVLCEDRFEARWETLDHLHEERGMTTINTFESPTVIAAHGTIGLEILEEVPEVEVILVPISSGGLLAGVATAVKSKRPEVVVIGVQPEGSSAMYRSFRKRQLVRLDRVDTICDALVATKPGALPFEHVLRYVDDVALVSDEEVKKAVRRLAETAKQVVEPSGAVGVAALLVGRMHFTGKKVAALVSGGNVALERYEEILRASG